MEREFILVMTMRMIVFELRLKPACKYHGYTVFAVKISPPPPGWLGGELTPNSCALTSQRD